MFRLAGKLFERYEGLALDNHTRFRWGYLAPFHSILRAVEARKVLQGIFDGIEFFIRLVKLPSEMDISYGDMVHTHLGYACTICMITNDQNAVFTPCSYGVQSISNPLLKEIVSYRGRFTEQAAVGDVVWVGGRLERVVNLEKNHEYLRVVVGEQDTDYMIPLEKWS